MRSPEKEKRIDKTLDESFPASDPPSFTNDHAGDKPPRPAQNQEKQPDRESGV